jgi:hypothetical protein
MDGFEPAAFGRREVVGEAEAGQLRQCPAEAVQRPLEGGCPRRDRRPLVLLGRQVPERIGQQMAAIRLVSDTVGGHQAQRFVRRDLVAGDGLEEVVLILGRERHERAGERGADGAAGELVLGLRTEPRAQRQAALHPVALAPEQMRGAAERQLVLVHERADHARLVQRGQRPWRGVGAKEQALVRHRRLCRLDHHRHQLVPLLLPALEALESVEDFVAPVGRDGHAHRQLRPLIGPRWQRARPQTRVASTQTRDRDVSNRPRHVAEGRTRSNLCRAGGVSTNHRRAPCDQNGVWPAPASRR